MKFSIDSWFWDKTSSWKNRQSAGTYANGWDYLGNGKYALLVNFPTYLDSRPYMGDAANRLDTLSNNCS